MAEPDCRGRELPPPGPSARGPGAATLAGPVADRERWADAAAGVRERLAAHAHRLSDGGVVWKAPVRAAAGAKPALHGPHLYDGSCGVALFLAADHLLTGDLTARELALAAVAPLRLKVRQLAADPGRAAALRLGVGGLVGAGSFLYAFARLAEWLEDADLLADAARCLPLIGAERIAADDRFDVTSGCAGAILALLAFERRTAAAGDRADGEAALAAAAACARRLLAARVSWQGRPRGWPGPEGRPPLGGFAHGAAGIAYALLRLHRRTGEEDYRRAALEAYAFERGLYLPEVDGWLDPRFGRPVEQSAWCHGTPGIALGRVGGLGAVDDAETREEIGRALRSTLALPIARRDHLCCGNAGRIEILHTAARALDRDDLAAAAARLAGAMLDRAEASGGLAVETADDGAPPDAFSPSLFLGVAGVGYTLLRLAHPEALPCPLLLD